MSDNKDKPARWTSHFEPMGGYDCMTDAVVIKDEAGRTVAELDFQFYKRFAEGSDADRVAAQTRVLVEERGRLIAAAPALRDALEKAWDVLSEMGCEHFRNADEIEPDCVVCGAEAALKLTEEKA